MVSEEPIKDAVYYLQQDIEKDASYVREVLLRCCVLPGEPVNLITSVQLIDEWHSKVAYREWMEEEIVKGEEKFMEDMETSLEEEYKRCGYIF